MTTSTTSNTVMMAKLLLLLVIVISTMVAWIVIRFKVESLIEVDDEGNRRWDGPEAERYRLVSVASMYNLVVLVLIVVGSIVLFARKKSSSTFSMGLVGGAMAMYANLAFLCCWYFVSFHSQEEEDENEGQGRRLGNYDYSNYNYDKNGNLNYNNYNYNNNNNNYNYNQEEEEEQEGKLQRMLSLTSLLVAVVYGILSTVLYRTTSNQAAAKAEDTTTILNDVWNFTSNFSLATVGFCFLTGFLSLFIGNGNGEEEEHRREEEEGATIGNFLLIAAHLLVLLGVLRVWGTRCMATAPSGFWVGSLLCLAAPTLFVTIVYGGFMDQEDDHRRREEEGTLLGPVAMRVLGLVTCTIAVLHNLLGSMVWKHHVTEEQEEYSGDEDDYVVMNADSMVEANSIVSTTKKQKDVEMTETASSNYMSLAEKSILS